MLALCDYYRLLGLGALEQLSDVQLHDHTLHSHVSAVTLVQHVFGNSRSRWTEFLTTDGEKEDRHRDQEFVDQNWDRSTILEKWHDAWDLFADAINSIQPNQLSQFILIRNQQHTILEAYMRQLAHLSYHTGQLVFIAKVLKGEEWQTLSIPIGESSGFNQKHFDESVKRHPLFGKNHYQPPH